MTNSMSGSGIFSALLMKTCLYSLLVCFVSCTGQQSVATPKVRNSKSKTYASENAPFVESFPKDICWKGNLDGSTLVFIHYSIEKEVLVGEIIYLNSKQPKPIKIIGELLGENYRILEFSKDGNITGVITGTPTKTVFNGEWFSPKSRKTLKMALTKNDSIIRSIPFAAKPENVFGNYHYQYSVDGYNGNFNFQKVTNKMTSFEVVSITDAPARNIASVDMDTIPFNGTEFKYKIPYGDGCEMRVRFFSDFLIIDYPEKYCTGVFGMNATVEGIFLKVK